MSERFFTESIIRASSAGIVRGTASCYYDGTTKTEFKNPVFTERIERGAWDSVARDIQSGKNGIVRLYRDHNKKQPLDQTPSLKIWSDRDGLQFEYDSEKLKGVSYVDDLNILISRGLITQCSFEATAIYKNEKNVRSIREFRDLKDISICTDEGAYGNGATLHIARSADLAEEQIKEYERWLRTQEKLASSKK